MLLNQSFALENIIPRLELYLVLLTALVLLAAAGAFVLYGLVLFLRWRGREERSLSFALVQIALPRDNEVKIDAAEQFFSSLASISSGGEGLLGFLEPPEHLTFEIVATPGDIRFYVSMPRELKDLVEKQIHGAYPGAEIKEVQEYNIFSKEGSVAFASLKLVNEDYKPIKVYKDLPTDPISSITANLVKMQKGEGAALQFVVSPADSKWSGKGASYVRKIKKQEADPEKAKYKVDAKELEAVENKIAKPGFNVEARVVVSAQTKTAADMHLNNLKSALAQFASAQNKFTTSKLWLKGMFMMDVIYRYFPILNFWKFRRTSVLSTEELATVFHFPNKTVETPHIYWLNARRAPAPANLPNKGLYIGKSVYRGITQPVKVGAKDRRRHFYIIGKTGVGKSEQLKTMILQDIKAGRGVGVLDPHDLIEKLLPLIPPERAEDVIYFNPGDIERPMGLNMLEAKTEDQKHFVVNSIIGLMYKLYDPMKTGIIGPRFEHAIRNAMLTAMSRKGATFVEVVRILTDEKFVKELLSEVEDPMVRRYWTDQIAQTSDFHKSRF